ncbi:hypothetical protein [Roseobacter sp.]|uniref:hypothetical protein n=1 Tax=Roseobacter sp. TaxID=1907202 RepID=UPI002966074D|nr:hypothetical protein [Roseobacter sp.]MDW3181748.1 hypothetical protein [Roseobacter sp.]
MDVNWFKKQQKLAGATSEDIAALRGRDRSIVSKIYNGSQKMTLEWAQAFATALNVSIDLVLEKSGSLPAEKARELRPGFSEGDAAPWVGRGGAKQKIDTVAEALGVNAPGIDVWVVSSMALSLMGYMPGDKIAVDTNKSESAKSGDAVIAQIYNWNTGTAVTLLRRFEPPVLVAASNDPTELRVHVVDGQNVVIKGVVVAAWRS